MAVQLHADSLSPDPLYGHASPASRRFGQTIALFPCECVRANPDQLRTGRTLQAGGRFRPHTPLVFRPDASGRLDIVVDFGTELEAGLELIIALANPPCDLFVTFGESLPEAEGWGLPTTNPMATVHWHVGRPGKAKRIFARRGFRFVRLQAFCPRGTVTFEQIAARAFFAFNERKGDFQCDDRRLQRAWQSSVYTARLCSREDCYWDGIKRDRVGWYGDARVTQETTDTVFHDPRPAERMLLKLPTDSWTMGIPGFSFAAVGMLRQLVLWHGVTHPAVTEIYERIRRLMSWVGRTQADRTGFIKRDPKVDYFGRVAFVDWSPMPVGGRFPELSWLQCQHLEALRNAAQLARWLANPEDERAFRRAADRLAANIMRTFWHPGRGMIHTLNRTTRTWQPLVVLPLPVEKDNDYRRKYFRNPPLGPSGPSRHANALAVWAGLLTDAAAKRTALSIFRSNRIAPLITAYFMYFEQRARAACGDPAGALVAMRDFVGAQLEDNDGATVWEWYNPAVQDFRKWGLGDWPKSLCHGFGTGLVPLVTRHLVGIVPAAPGFREVAFAGRAALPVAFEARLPTPLGPIIAQKDRRDGKMLLRLPPGMKTSGDAPCDVAVERA